ncbi:VanZ family protein [Amycolatopsis minnesotensis]|uniref:VanZ family protein n=1 Tax=Amycolatopsis minnesotensis TaxID=337894 RepID=A0ABP5CTJ6_9PSEU
MTTAQVTAIGYGLLAFVAVWATIGLPQLLVQRAKHGRVDLGRVVRTGAVTLYSCLAVAVVMLPLPGPGTKPLEQTIQLQPFQWVADIGTELHKYGLSTADWFTTQTFQQAAMNVLLFVPLGIFAKLWWRRGFTGATLLGFGASLLIEITQLTANFGTAPFQYRIFDVDDLMTNTAGATLGWTAAALFAILRAGIAKAVVAKVETPVTMPVRLPARPSLDALRTTPFPVPARSAVYAQPARRQRVDFSHSR